MRDVPPALLAHLASGATTTAKCWRLILADGSVKGFTEHDRDLVFDGVVHRAATGLSGTAMASQTGLAVGDQTVSGVLSDDGIEEGALEAGLYDGATVATWLVNWGDVSQRVLLASGEIGEVTRSARGFEAEVRSLASRLNVPVGRSFQPACDAVLGDARCGVPLDDEAYRGEGEVVSSEGDVLAVTGLEAFAGGWFAGGRLTWTSGANEGLAVEVRASSPGQIGLWRHPVRGVAPGDGFIVTAGCNKSFATCRTKFANGVNFRGCPHMPGNDWVLAYPGSADRNDGTRRTR